jgi:outer membrane lipoprotein SlyB
MVNPDVMARIAQINSSDTLVVLPIGDPENKDRAILQVNETKWPKLRHAVLQTFGAAILALSVAVPQQAHAEGVGYNADVYGAGNGQVMQQGVGERMVVIGTRQVKIDVPAQQEGLNPTLSNAVTYGAGILGAVIGNKIGGNGPNSRMLGTAVGAVGGASLGYYANKLMNGRSSQMTGTEITMRNVDTNQIATVTQAGDQQFAEGQRVFMVVSGGTTRVIPDNSRDNERQQDSSNYVTHAVDGRTSGEAREVKDILHSGEMMGIQLDPAKVDNLLSTGEMPNHKYVGRVVGVDRDLGLVYQDVGRGQGVIHLASSLSHVPKVGENITVNYKNNFGLVASRQVSQSYER